MNSDLGDRKWPWNWIFSTWHIRLKHYNRRRKYRLQSKVHIQSGETFSSATATVTAEFVGERFLNSVDSGHILYRDTIVNRDNKPQSIALQHAAIKRLSAPCAACRGPCVHSDGGVRVVNPCIRLADNNGHALSRGAYSWWWIRRTARRAHNYTASPRSLTSRRLQLAPCTLSALSFFGR